MASTKKATIDAGDAAVTSPQAQDTHAKAALAQKNAQTTKAATAHVVQATGEMPLTSGTLLIICAKPGFRRAGIEHERLKIWDKNAFTAEQMDQLRREPMLTLIEVR